MYPCSHPSQGYTHHSSFTHTDALIRWHPAPLLRHLSCITQPSLLPAEMRECCGGDLLAGGQRWSAVGAGPAVLGAGQPVGHRNRQPTPTTVGKCPVHRACPGAGQRVRRLLCPASRDAAGHGSLREMMGSDGAAGSSCIISGLMLMQWGMKYWLGALGSGLLLIARSNVCAW